MATGWVSVFWGVCFASALSSVAVAGKPKKAAPAPVAPAPAPAAPVAPSAPAVTYDSFEAALGEATPVADLTRLFDPLFADCTRDDELQARQCTSIRDWLVERMKGEIFSAVGDDSALTWAPFDPSEKKLELDVQGCLACGKPLSIDGKQRFATTRVPKAIKAGHAVGLDLGFHDVTMKDEKEAAAWQKKMEPRLRVQFVFRVGPVWKSGTFEGVTFVPVAHRVFDKCNGKVVASEPPSAKDALPIPDESCPEELTPEQEKARDRAALPLQLTTKQINAALAAARDKVHDCFTEFEVAGTATIHLVVQGDGNIETLAILPPFDKTPTGYCIRSSLKGTQFPHFRGEKMIVNYPFQLK
jgi:hypothetical protein